MANLSYKSAQRYNKRMNEIFEYARKVGAIKDEVTCGKCMKVMKKKDVDMMGLCKKCRKKTKDKEAFIPAGMGELWKEEIEHAKHYPFGDD